MSTRCAAIARNARSTIAIGPSPSSSAATATSAVAPRCSAVIDSRRASATRRSATSSGRGLGRPDAPGRREQAFGGLELADLQVGRGHQQREHGVAGQHVPAQPRGHVAQPGVLARGEQEQAVAAHELDEHLLRARRHGVVDGHGGHVLPGEPAGRPHVQRRHDLGVPPPQVGEQVRAQQRLDDVAHAGPCPSGRRARSRVRARRGPRPRPARRTGRRRAAPRRPRRCSPGRGRGASAARTRSAPPRRGSPTWPGPCRPGR